MSASQPAVSGAISVREFAELAGVSASGVRKWIRAGLVVASTHAGRVEIPLSSNGVFLQARVQKKYLAPQQAYVPPEITRYSKWHEILDELLWLLKITYSEPKDLKRRRFRLDVLFGNYIRDNAINLKKLRSTFLPPSGRVPDVIWEDLQRGWYNELAFSMPPRTRTLGLSFNDIEPNDDATATRYMFPSWRITNAYYAVYFYLRAVTRLKQPSFRLEEHGATLTNFKSCALKPFEATAWFFPLNIAYDSKRRLRRRALPVSTISHLKFKYARHPRPPNRTPGEVFDHIQSTFRARAGKKASHYTLFDYLREFRVWANYLEIEHLVNLRGRGYKAFLDQALSALLFFVGGLTELVFMSCVGETRFRNRSQRFYTVLSASNQELQAAYPVLPLSQRLELFRAIGLTRRSLTHFVTPDPNRVQASFDRS